MFTKTTKSLRTRLNGVEKEIVSIREEAGRLVAAKLQRLTDLETEITDINSVVMALPTMKENE